MKFLSSSPGQMSVGRDKRCLFGLWLPNSIISTGEKMKCYRDVLRMFVVVVGPMQLYFLSKREDVKPPFLPRNPSR
uniref:Uncharacterized protein n=1 Tax=Daucus carota subsp. sativus TaxID=79200 RepID=A0A166GYT9_DAUCS